MLKSSRLVYLVCLLFVSSAFAGDAASQGKAKRDGMLSIKPGILSGAVVTALGETIGHATVTATTASGEQKAITGNDGKFSFKSFNGGVTKVANSFYRGTYRRAYVSNAPHVVATAGLTLSQWRGFSGSVRLNYVGNYRLDELDAGIRASGLTVVDFSMLKRVRPWLDLNLSIDNLLNKTYYETQNYFESRLLPTDPAVERIHGTPGFPIGCTAGLTFHLAGK